MSLSLTNISKNTEVKQKDTIESLKANNKSYIEDSLNTLVLKKYNDLDEKRIKLIIQSYSQNKIILSDSPQLKLSSDILVNIVPDTIPGFNNRKKEDIMGLVEERFANEIANQQEVNLEELQVAVVFAEINNYLANEEENLTTQNQNTLQIAPSILSDLQLKLTPSHQIDFSSTEMRQILEDANQQIESGVLTKNLAAQTLYQDLLEKENARRLLDGQEPLTEEDYPKHESQIIKALDTSRALKEKRTLISFYSRYDLVDLPSNPSKNQLENVNANFKEIVKKLDQKIQNTEINYEDFIADFIETSPQQAQVFIRYVKITDLRAKWQYIQNQARKNGNHAELLKKLQQAENLESFINENSQGYAPTLQAIHNAHKQLEEKINHSNAIKEQNVAKLTENFDKSTIIKEDAKALIAQKPALKKAPKAVKNAIQTKNTEIHEDKYGFLIKPKNQENSQLYIDKSTRKTFVILDAKSTSPRLVYTEDPELLIDSYNAQNFVKQLGINRFFKGNVQNSLDFVMTLLEKNLATAENIPSSKDDLFLDLSDNMKYLSTLLRELFQIPHSKALKIDRSDLEHYNMLDQNGTIKPVKELGQFFRAKIAYDKGTARYDKAEEESFDDGRVV